MAEYDSYSWTGRRPYSWAKNYFCVLSPYVCIELGKLYELNAFGFRLSFWRTKNPSPGQRLHSVYYTKIFVTAQEAMNGQ